MWAREARPRAINTRPSSPLLLGLWMSEPSCHFSVAQACGTNRCWRVKPLSTSVIENSMMPAVRLFWVLHSHHASWQHKWSQGFQPPGPQA